MSRVLSGSECTSEPCEELPIEQFALFPREGLTKNIINHPFYRSIPLEYHQFRIRPFPVMILARHLEAGLGLFTSWEYGEAPSQLGMIWDDHEALIKLLNKFINGMYSNKIQGRFFCFSGSFGETILDFHVW